MLGYVELLNELDTSAVEPMAHVADLANVFRDDELRPSLPRAAALSNAPKTDGKYFVVPQILEEG
ncbi:MAG: aspartyl-tRNA(Asn)/glutamyl-tRNA (Gln) amidotransferase subunit C [Planctomycetota bacterium]|nr:MAG: aspartyl-tRNA(Asn)/glutamyl-tRNA (Gln) amidotransferase subunit C [Planctomycetota bacterium]